ncbi:MAG TPA: flagellar basal body P-ring protein FlgI [Armatimonadota bacterium]|nr:flagellar basal body P-ring protein FlgI [Armatimonadota bacterium]
MPNGAIVEREVPVTAVRDGHLTLCLTRPDFSTAERVAAAINARLGGGTALPADAGSVSVAIPSERAGNLVALVAELEALPVQPDTLARVVINERTGTVVIGGRVIISPVAISHGGLVVEIKRDAQVSQPAPLGKGKTTVTQHQDMRVQEEQAAVFPLEGTTIEQLVQALNAIHLTPRDIIAILQAIKEAGALQADLEII